VGLLQCFHISGTFRSVFIHSSISERRKNKTSPFANIILPMVWIAVLVTVVFNSAGYSGKREERKLIAIKLATEKNPLTEFLYSKLEHKLMNDSLIIAKIKNSETVKEETLIKRIKSEYIRDFWNRFYSTDNCLYSGEDA